PAAYLVKAATAHLRGFVTGQKPERVARDLFDDQITDIILQRSTSTQAAVGGTSAWAASMAGIAVYDLVQSVTSLSAAADLIDRALKLNMDGIAEMRVPGRSLIPGAWVGEGNPAPVKQLTFANDAVLQPRKLTVITTYSSELADHSNIENVVRQTLG